MGDEMNSGRPDGTGQTNPGAATRLDDERLAPYLVHHLLAAGSGVRLYRAVTRTWTGTEHEAVLRRTTADVAADRRELASLIRRLGYRVPPARRVMGLGAATVARLDPINPLRRRGTQAAQLELEALESAVDMKESLWDTLLALPPGAGLDRSALQRLKQRAGEQRERLTAIRRKTAPARFLR